MSNIFFTSDTHFGHANIIQYSNRPFQNVEEMNGKLIENWNKTVTKQDVVYHLGDFLLGKPEHVWPIINRLNFGFLYLIKGNHENAFCNWYKVAQPKNIYLYNSYLEGKFNGKTITLCHYAMRVWNKSHHGAYHLYGHSHGTLPDNPNSLSFDVGVDCHNYKPISLDEVVEIMNKKTFKPIDHHGQTGRY